ncbi:Nucleoporin [Wickerhamomyces ciferrii]|uniref:Nucleoporin n=1 Tax=Wickerhamomyces ciferrii (strain ATCC 14091 / BCRC 22168 / CBS 111 / JCM 3599 / NBRC 0793 / NRRL Y-1031 F-60-10) TaxID=1206466 RepID=K0K6I9_WICCF|nr:Nucleoporin [Wickerhamomyces ciferrii]CCH40550.1 Nucleoporin [Wickerhamomyces ciferrii]
MFGSSNTNSGFGSGFGVKPSGFGSSTPQNNNTTGGLFGNSKPSSGFSFGSGQTNNATSGFGSNNATPLSANKPATGGLFGNSASNTSGTGSGLFGNNNNTTSTGQTGGGLFGNNNNNNNNTNQASGGGLFGNNSTQSNTTTGGGLFGNSANNNTNSGGGLFGNTSNTNTGGGLFGNSSTTNNAPKPNTGFSLFGNSSSTSQAPKPGLFGSNSNTTTQPSTGLFGSNNNTSAPGSSLFSGSNNNQLNQNTSTPPAKQYNFKDLPKSITESAKASKHPLSNNVATRKRTSSNSSGSSVSAPQGQRSGILERLSTRFSTLKSQARYDSEGLFSPKKDLLHSALPNDNQEATSTKLFVRPFSTTTHNPRSSTNATRRRILTTEYLKLKVDPSRSESRRLKIFGETGGAKKIRVLGREDENTIDWEVNGSVVSNDENPVETKTNEKDELIEESNGDQDNKKTENVSEGIKNASNDDEYWCSPSIDELANLQLRQLAEISDFTIGRKGYGSISFDLPVDLTAFASDLSGHLFGNVVKFNKNRTVEVYPNDKIPLGSGLNVPATITLEKCFPTSRKGRHAKPEDTTTKDLELRLFIRKLKELKDMEFVTYDPFSGAWTFKVKHFSIWGLVNEDDDVVDVDSEVETLKNQTREAETKKENAVSVNPIENTNKLSSIQHPNPFKSRNLAEDTFLFKKQKIDDSFDFDTTDLMPGSFISGQTYDLIRTQQEKPEDVNESPSPILSDDDDDSVTIRDNGAVVPIGLVHGDESFINGEDDYSMNEDPDILDEKQYEPIDVDQEDFRQLEVDPKLAVADDWNEQLKLSARADSVYAADEFKNSKQIKDSLNRGLTPGDLDNLIFGDFKKIIEAQKKIKKELRFENYNFSHYTNEAKLLVRDSKSASFVKEKQLDEEFGNINKETLRSIYQKHLNLSKIITRPNKIPKVVKNSDLTFDFIVDAFKGDSKNKEKSIWTLSSILFDTNNLLTAELSKIDDTEVVNKVIEVKRRENLVEWIKNEIQLDIKSKIQQIEDFSEQIFLHLVIFDISSAAKLAINTSNPYLSVLISLLGSNDPNVKFSAAKQIEEWKKNAVLQTIPKGILKIYYLLKGDVLTKDPIAKLSEGLSWKARLGLSLFYGDTNESIATSITTFVASSPSDIKGEDEIYFNLLKLFVHKTNDKYPISSIISALKPSKTLDVRFQWYIYEILIRSTEQLNFKRSVEFGDQLVLLFAEQLQAVELWEEALFVLAHLNNDYAAEHHVKSLLTRKIEVFNKDTFLIERLVDQLRVPKSLISEANALYNRYIGNHWDEASFLLDAGKYEDAHSTIVSNVAPLAVINNGPQLEKLGELIRRFPKSKHISNWSNGLEIYKNYLDLINKDTDKSLKFLADNLQSLEQTTFHIKVAIRLIAKVVAEKITTNAEIKDSKVPVKQILKLPLGEGESQFYAAPLVLKEIKGRFLKGA